MGRRVMNAALRATVNTGRRRRALPYGPSPPSRSPSSTSSSTEVRATPRFWHSPQKEKKTERERVGFHSCGRKESQVCWWCDLRVLIPPIIAYDSINCGGYAWVLVRETNQSPHVKTDLFGLGATSCKHFGPEYVGSFGI